MYGYVMCDMEAFVDVYCLDSSQLSFIICAVCNKAFIAPIMVYKPLHIIYLKLIGAEWRIHVLAT